MQNWKKQETKRMKRRISTNNLTLGFDSAKLNNAAKGPISTEIYFQAGGDAYLALKLSVREKRQAQTTNMRFSHCSVSDDVTPNCKTNSVKNSSSSKVIALGANRKGSRLPIND